MERKIEFVAKTFADVGKGILVVGFASYFFKEFPFTWRVTISILSLGLIVVSICIYPEKGGEP